VAIEGTDLLFEGGARARASQSHGLERLSKAFLNGLADF
jgi:hypothetical protein